MKLFRTPTGLVATDAEGVTTALPFSLDDLFAALPT